jgi:hypothetical protein
VNPSRILDGGFWNYPEGRMHKKPPYMYFLLGLGSEAVRKPIFTPCSCRVTRYTNPTFLGLELVPAIRTLVRRIGLPLGTGASVMPAETDSLHVFSVAHDSPPPISP